MIVNVYVLRFEKVNKTSQQTSIYYDECFSKLYLQLYLNSRNDVTSNTCRIDAMN